jgi:hypothetical protein
MQRRAPWRPLRLASDIVATQLINLFLIFLPILMGLIVSFSLIKIDESKFAIRGVTSSYISAVALLFSLYGGLMAKEVWDKRTSLDNDIGTEISSLRSLLRITEAVDPNNDTQIRSEIYRYMDEIRKEEYEMRVSETNFIKAIPLQSLYNLVIQDGVINDSSVKSAFLNSLEKLRSARIDRLLTELDAISNEKLAVLFLFGFLTQVAIGLAHVGHSRVVFVTIMLFSLGFSGSIFTLLRFDDVYRTGDLISKIPLKNVK